MQPRKLTLSTSMYDVTNYGYYSGNNEHAAIIAKNYTMSKKLNANTLVLGECGHGSRSTR